MYGNVLYVMYALVYAEELVLGHVILAVGIHVLNPVRIIVNGNVVHRAVLDV